MDASLLATIHVDVCCVYTITEFLAVTFLTLNLYFLAVTSSNSLYVITAPALLATLVRFLMTASVDNKLIIEVLVQRISCNGKVCVVTMQFFETLLSLNIEDVMLSLVFRHLVNCNFLLPSFR